MRIPTVLLHAVEYHAFKQNRTLFKNYTIQNMHKAAGENRLKSSPPSPNSYLGPFRENISKRKEMQTFQGGAQQLLKPIVQSLLFCTQKTKLIKTKVLITFLQYMYPTLHHSKIASAVRAILFILSTIPS